MPTLEEIARLSQTSRSTVSRVINDDPHVSQETRDKVMAVVQQLDYRPNLAARSLAVGRTRILGLVIPAGVARLFTDPYFPILIQGVTSACNASNHTVMLWLAEPEYERQMIGQIMHSGLIDGVVVSSGLIDDPLLVSLAKSSLPFVMIGRHPNDLQVSSIDVDNQGSAQQAVTHLLRNGRRRVATISGPQAMAPGLDRLAGYQAALRARGLRPDQDLIAGGDFSEESGYCAMQRLLSKPVDAVFAASDAMAIGAMRAIREGGYRIPEDIAVVGFDDIPAAARTDPSLTTVRQPIQRLGALAVETVIDIIETADTSPRRVILPTELVIRQSG